MVTKIIYEFSKLLRSFGIEFNEDSNAKVLAMKNEIADHGHKIEFKIEQYPDGTWTAESVNFDGIITSGKNTKEISDNVRDAVFTYFEIPPHLCVDALLRADNEPVTLTQRVYAKS